MTLYSRSDYKHYFNRACPKGGHGTKKVDGVERVVIDCPTCEAEITRLPVLAANFSADLRTVPLSQDEELEAERVERHTMMAQAELATAFAESAKGLVRSKAR